MKFRLNLRNVATVFACLAATTMMTSCQKDGVYNPNKKISKVFYQYSGSGKYLAQTWTWDKNNLSRITYNGGDFVRFDYDGKRVSKITDNEGWGTTRFTYSGSKLDKIDYSSEEVNIVYKPVYKGSKMEKVTITLTYLDWDPWDYAPQKAIVENLTWQIFMPEQMMEKNEAKLKSSQQSRKSGNTETFNITYTWKGDNITKMVFEGTDEDGKLYTDTYEYKEYDKSKNPLYGLLYGGEIIVLESKNNPKKMTNTESGGYYSETEYSYRCNGKFPEEITRTMTVGKNTYTLTTYYEYE